MGFLASSSKQPAKYSFYVRSIATYAPTFLGHNNSVLATHTHSWFGHYFCSNTYGHAPSNQITVVAFQSVQLAQASFLQKNQTLQNVFLISVMLRWHRA